MSLRARVNVKVKGWLEKCVILAGTPGDEPFGLVTI